MIEKINKLLEAIKDLIKSYPEDILMVELQRWEKRLYQYRELKKMQDEIKLVKD